MNSINICWEEFGKSIRCTNKETDHTTLFKLGDIICGDNKNPLIITEFTGNDPNGPIGMCYIPVKHRWSRTKFKQIICYPTGISHVGQHIDWSTIIHHPNYKR